MTETQFAQLAQLMHRTDGVAFAFLFGSSVSGRLTDDSDVDLAVYFSPFCETDDERAGGRAAVGRPPLQIEETNARFPGENRLWSAAERICARPVDLVVLNRAPANIATAALLTGRTLCIRDQDAYLRFMLIVTTLAEEFRDFMEDFVRIKERSQSLSELDRGRLIRALDFLRSELRDADAYAPLDASRYRSDAIYRRSAERWVENLVNASIDAAKIVLASEGQPLPQTYRATLEALGHVAPFQKVAGRLADNARIRNMLAHEYLDLRYTQTAAVAEDAVAVYGGLLAALDAWME